MRGLLDTLERRGNLQNPDKKLLRLLRGRPETASKVDVDAGTVLSSVAVFAAVRLLAGDLASVPLPVFRNRGGVREPDREHPAFELMNLRPNPEQTAFEFREMRQGHLMLFGRFYAEKIRGAEGGGQVRRLWPLMPWRTTKRRLSDGELVFEVTSPAGGAPRVLPARRVLEVQGFSLNGLTGLDPVQLAAEMFGITLASEQHAGRFYGSGMSLDGVLSHPATLTDEVERRLRKQLEKRKGLSARDRVLILEEGIKFQETAADPQKGQLHESRKFQVTEVARWSRVPPHMLYDLERSTFSNIEHQAIEYTRHSVRPWAVRTEARDNISLFTDDEIRAGYFVEHNLEGLLRGDIKTRFEAYTIGRQWGFLSPNEIRRLENLAPIPNGDVYHVPLNMVELGDDALSDERSLLLRLELARRMAEDDDSLPPVIDLGRIPSPPRGRIGAPEFRNFQERMRLRGAFRSVLEDAADRLTRRETGAVRQAVEDVLGQRDIVDFKRWLERFYRETFPGMAERALRGPMTTYGLSIGEAAAAELGSELDRAQLERFLATYFSTFVTSRSAGGENQLFRIIEDARESGGDAAGGILQRLDEWREKAPAKLAFRQVVKLESAAARSVFSSSGVTRLGWRAFGESCPYCRELNGRVVSIDAPFLAAEEPFEPEGAERALTPPTAIHHPPGHGGCDCGLAAVI